MNIDFDAHDDYNDGGWCYDMRCNDDDDDDDIYIYNGEMSVTFLLIFVSRNGRKRVFPFLDTFGSRNTRKCA